MSNYYCLVAGLPELSLDDCKLSYSVADFKKDIYPELSTSDRLLIDLFYLKFDNANLLALLADNEADIDERGNYSRSELCELIAQVKDGAEKVKNYPSYFVTFLIEYCKGVLPENFLAEDRLATYYFDYAMKAKNTFVASWFQFNMTVNNLLIAFAARKYQLEVAPLIVGTTDISTALRTSGARDFGLTGELDFLESVIKLSDITDLVEREKKTDWMRWEWMENNSFFNYFTVEKLFVFLLKLEMIERWLSLDKEKGNQMFREIIDRLKDDVRIPEEFK